MFNLGLSRTNLSSDDEIPNAPSLLLPFGYLNAFYFANKEIIIKAKEYRSEVYPSYKAFHIQ
jgi:hypothetical protein